MTPATTQNLWSVTSGVGQFVAVGEASAVVSSPDGISWVSRPVSPAGYWLVSVGYGAGMWVIVGDKGLILTSTNLVSWTVRTSGTSSRINGVAYGGGRWIAVAESGELLTSLDGINWSTLKPSGDRLHGIVYAYGQFVITGDNGLVRTTIDVTDYAERTLPGSMFLEVVTYARRAFVAIGEGGFAVRSSDGVNWEPVNTGKSSHFRGLTYFNTQFIAAGTDGAILTGGGQRVLVRGVGPGLTAFGITGALPDPTISLVDSSGRAVASNDNFDSNPNGPTPGGLVEGVGAFRLTSSLDAAFVATLPAGAYTVQLADTASRSGVGLLEVYRADDSPTRLVNLSSRGYVGTGAALAIAGIAVEGEFPRQFLIRGVGPALQAFGVGDALADPVLNLTSATGESLFRNDDWGTSANAPELVAISSRLGAFPLATGSKDAALLVTLAPGNYTALVNGVGDTTGTALIEVYEVP